METSGETRGRGQAPPLLVEHLVKISAACPDNLTGLRDRALVLMHFAVAGRRHELAFNRVRDYAETPDGIQADLRVSKVRPPRRAGPLRLPALDLPGQGLAGVEGGRRSHRPGRLRLAPPAQPLAHSHGERAAARVHRRRRHPRRRARRDRDPLHRPQPPPRARHLLPYEGHDQIVIAKQGGWAPHSKVLAGYLEVVDQWEDNALLGVL